jgi:hypothetical protein
MSSSARTSGVGTGTADRLATAATRLYDAEIALHIARQTGVDSWVAAAYDRLHLAVEDDRASRRAG